MVEAAQQYGIKETKEALDLAFAAIHCGISIAEDKKVDLQDLTHVIALVPMLQPGLGDIALVPKEIGELSTEEANELVAYAAAKLTLPGAKAKIYVAYSLKLIQRALVIVGDIKAMQAELAAA